LNRYGAPLPHPEKDLFIGSDKTNLDIWRLLGTTDVPKRWLEPENVDLLISLLGDRRIAFPARVSDKRVAGFEDAMLLASNPVVPFQWIVEIRNQSRSVYEAHFSEGGAILIDHFMAHKILSRVMKRPNITTEELDSLSPPGMQIRPESGLAHQAFNSKVPGVVNWAIGRGLAPTNQQLTEYTK